MTSKWAVDIPFKLWLCMEWSSDYFTFRINYHVFLSYQKCV